MSQGEEERPERDVVEPTGSRQRWQLKYYLFRADEKLWSGLIHRDKTQEVTMAKGKGDSVLRKTWLLDHIHVLY